MIDNSTDRFLRPLGEFERVIDLYMHCNPVQFSLTAEFARDVPELELRQAFQELQRIHPLLTAEVDRRDKNDPRTTSPMFRHTTETIPIRVASDTTWQREAATEQTKPIEPAPGPLVRAVLIPSGNGHAGSTVVVTFAHQITDGRGALRAFEDLTAILNGAKLTPMRLPAAQEDLLTNLAPTSAPDKDTTQRGAALEQQGADIVASPPGRLRPFDGSLPTVQSGELGGEGTRRLLERSREESCTVQAALCAAAASVLFKQGKRDRVRINVPIDLRRAVGLDDEVVVRFSATTVVLDPSEETGFWELSRSASAQLGAARHPDTVRASALTLAQLAPTTADEAEEAMLAATTADIEITNLGVTRASTLGQEVHALWGPAMTTQVAGEQILGVVTHGDVLRMVNVTHDPIANLVGNIRSELENACH